MLEWFRALMPKEDRFFGLFEQHAALVVAGAESLRAALEGGSALPEHLQVVMDRENDADAITREVLREHAKSWGADEVRLTSGLTGRGWAGAETGVAGEAGCRAAARRDDRNRGC